MLFWIIRRASTERRIIKKNEKEKISFERSSSLYLILSIIIGLVVWWLISISSVGKVFSGPVETMDALITQIENGKYWVHICASMYRVIAGFLLGFLAAVPIAFLMGWYRNFRGIVEPWIQFIRNIPPIAYLTLVVVIVGVGEESKISVIFIASFLVMVISIYQGVRNVDVTLIKAARILGAKDRDIFFQVVIPASFPYILVGIRLGLSSALTTLVAAELTGSNVGLGQMINEASMYFRMPVVLLGIITIGIIGMILDKSVQFLERRLTGWQELRKL